MPHRVPRDERKPLTGAERLEAISGALREAVRREVQRLREQGLPVYVARNGHVVDASLTDESPTADDRTAS